MLDNKWFYTFQEIRELVKEANGYCINCNKPITYKPSITYSCQRCYKNKYTYGLDKRITFGEIGMITINYQQYLHRAIFGCNAPYKYRGLKENRLEFKPKKEAILKAVTKIETKLNTHPILGDIYKQLTKTTNITERILYNCILYYIAYYIENKIKDEDTFYASMIHALEFTIKKTHIRLYKVGKIKQEDTRNFQNHISQNNKFSSPKYNKELAKVLDLSIKPIIAESFSFYKAKQ